MAPRAQMIYDQLEKQRNELLTSIKLCGSDAHNRSVNGRWSINQILAHILTSERLSLAYMKKKSLGIHGLDDTGFFEVVKSFLLKVSQRLPLRFKAPRLIVDHTPAMTLAEIEHQWILQREELKEFLDSLEPQHIRKKIYKHPVAGRLNVLQAMDFFREHILHHLPQIKRLL